LTIKEVAPVVFEAKDEERSKEVVLDKIALEVTEIPPMTVIALVSVLYCLSVTTADLM
jgi:hypothetical protein